MLLFLISIVVSLTWSGFIVSLIGWHHYGAIATLAALLLLTMFGANERAHRRSQGLTIERKPGNAVIDLATMVVLALYFGATWPSLPLVTLIGRWTRGASDSADRRTASSDRRS